MTQTIEEAAGRLIFKTIGNKYGLSSIDEYDQVDGYFDTYLEAFLTLKLKWQAERMYSEEDMKLAWKDGRDGTSVVGIFPFIGTRFTYRSFTEWFARFKKK